MRSRIIPAHAGFTSPPPPGPCSRRDHPRTRGVYSNREPADYGWGGSSPHTRGLLRGRGGGLQYRRIIPAHAGFTRKRKLVDREGADHPRTRGVYEDIWIPVVKAIGSSPHTRGLPRADPSPVARLRIIPAHAGFTAGELGDGDGGQDHPRTRGVYALADPLIEANPGSSPHTRGLPPAHSRALSPRGIIPAHAGFTLCLSFWVCCWGGSSPHTRGLPSRLPPLNY